MPWAYPYYLFYFEIHSLNHINDGIIINFSIP